MTRWFRGASIGIAILLLLSGLTGLRVQAQGEGGIIPPLGEGAFPSSRADPPGDSTAHYSTNRQDEPWVALASDPKIVAMGFNDWSGNFCTNTTPSECGPRAGISLSGWVRYSDGGNFPDCRGRLDLSALGAFAFGDPGVVIGRPSGGQSPVYYSTIGFPLNNLTTTDLFVAKSTNSGCTYPTAQRVDRNVKFDDKPAIAVDNNSGSPCVDNVYVAWTVLGNGKPHPDKIMFSRSTDGGLTWDKPQQLSPASKFRSGAAVKVGRDGTVYVVWLDTRKGAQLTMAISSPPDCGAKFKGGGKHITVANANPFDGPPPAARFRVNSFPALATDPSDENTLYVVWADRTGNHTKILAVKSSTKGLTWSDPVVAGDVTAFPSDACVFPIGPPQCVSASAFFPALDVDPKGNVNLAFLALEDAPPGTAPGSDVVHYAMFVRQSKNSPLGTAGATWSDPLFGSGYGKCCKGDDPDASSTEDLKFQFLGDYISGVSQPLTSGLRRFLVAWTNSSSADTCDAVDNFRAGTGPKPNVIAQCPVHFGNTDILLTKAFTYTP